MLSARTFRCGWGCDALLASRMPFQRSLKTISHALSIYFMHYNFVRIHQTLRVTPAMAAGITDTLWSLEDMVRIVNEWEANQKEKAS